MISLTNHKELRAASLLPFCYLCCRPFAADDAPSDIDRDHVPPRVIFAKDHRDPPLVLRTHRRCNAFHSERDEQVGQLVRLLHTPATSLKAVSKLRLSTQGKRVAKGMEVAIEGIPLNRIIASWVRGFHAALYREPLASFDGQITEPLPSSDDLATVNPVLPQHLAMVDLLKQSRTINRYDRIETCAGRFRYHCVWAEFDQGGDFCAFAIDLYDWMKLGGATKAPPRSCVGFYIAARPASAARASKVLIPTPNFRRFDAFRM